MSRFSDTVIGSIVDGDLHAKINNITYSTNPREIITVGMVESHYRINGHLESDGVE